MRFTPFSICNFQFTTSQGGRPQCKEIIYGRGFFQFTTSQGGRQTLWMTHTADLLFQFTTSQGGRRILLMPRRSGINLSIHDLTRRSTFYRTVSSLAARSFNSRPHKEVDVSVSLPHSLPYIFQFTTSQGGRPEFEVVRSVRCPFNSRPHKEVDLRRASCILKQDSFNSRPHKEVDTTGTNAQRISILSIHDLTRRSTLSP